MEQNTKSRNSLVTYVLWIYARDYTAVQWEMNDLFNKYLSGQHDLCRETES